jgi:K+-sensing histidine kinase KdpD
LQISGILYVRDRTAMLAAVSHDLKTPASLSPAHSKAMYRRWPQGRMGRQPQAAR